MVCQSAQAQPSPEPGRTPVDLHVGRRLKARRILANMSQERLAAALGISYQQLQRYESGKGRLPSAMLYHAAVALNVPVGYFFEQLADTADPAIEPMVDKSTLAVARNLQEIADPHTRQCLVRLIDALSKPARLDKSARG